MGAVAGFSWGSEDLIGRMLERLAPRGTDAAGSYVAPEVSLGCRRLAVVDLGEQANQPLPNEDRTLWLVLDGQVYNHRELRRRLEARGHRFASAGHAEVVLHAFEEYGTGCLSKLNGAFAFAIWDSRARRLFLARDRLGIRPLYLIHEGERLLFASDPQALLEWEGAERELDRAGVLDYLGYGFIPAPRTIYRGISKLEPGRFAILEKGRLTEGEYWDVPSYRGNATRKEAEDQLISELEEAVRLRLNADVPVGVFLSGGLDSSLILALAASLGDSLPQTFALGAETGDLRDFTAARRLAARFGTEHHEVLVGTIGADDVLAATATLAEPSGESGFVAHHILCREARRHVRVALSGEGGDELFIGCPRSRASRIEARLRVVPGPLRRTVLEGLARRLPGATYEERGVGARVKRFVDGARLPAEGRHVRWDYAFGPEYHELLRDPDSWGVTGHDAFAHVRRLWDASRHHRYLNRESYVDLKLMLPNGPLARVDATSMAQGLEVRLPFLDHEVVELVAPFPPGWKLEQLRSHAMLRSAAERHRLLQGAALTREKRGFTPLPGVSLRGPLRDLLLEMVEGSEVLGELFDREALRRTAGQHLAGRRNHDAVLWRALGLAVWDETRAHGSDGGEAAHARREDGALEFRAP